MTYPSSINLLPKKYQALSTIVSIEHRLALCDTLVSITGLLRDLQGAVADPSTKRLVDRYFTYLDHSCLSKIVLNDRAKWLGTYSKIVEYRLTLAVDKTMRKPVAHSLSPDLHFSNKLMELAEAIGAYRQHVRDADPQDDEDVIMMITKLLSIAETLVPNHQHSSYQSLVTMVDNLTDNLRNLAALPYPPPCSHSLLMRLMELHYVVSQYKLF